MAMAFLFVRALSFATLDSGLIMNLMGMVSCGLNEVLYTKAGFKVVKSMVLGRRHK